MLNFTPHQRVLIQGSQEHLAVTYTPAMQAYGTHVVAAVNPGYGGQQQFGVPVFDLVESVQPALGPIDTSILFLPPYAVLDGALEAIAAGIRQLLIVTAGVPPLDMVTLIREAEATETLILGPNSPGIIMPGQLLLGLHAPYYYQPGKVGLISRSGTLAHEIAWNLTQVGLGQSISVGLGSDTITGSTLSQWLQILDEDDNTEVIVLVGEIGGDEEISAARDIAEAMDKPVVAYIAGCCAPPTRDMGHAREIRLWQRQGQAPHPPRPDWGTAQRTIQTLQEAGVHGADRPSQVPTLVASLLASRVG